MKNYTFLVIFIACFMTLVRAKKDNLESSKYVESGANDRGITKVCDKRKCRGPIRFYEDLKCKGIYAKDGDCCAVRYDCSNLNKRSKDKCYANGHEYAIGEKLKKGDGGPCDICTCIKGFRNLAEFNCAQVYCPQDPPKEGCYLKQTISCCGTEIVCPKNRKVICKVEEKTYAEGEYFSPSNNPELSCQCLKNYKGKNVAPFCKIIKCGTEIHDGYELRKNCVPVFYSGQSPRTDCSVAYTCPSNNKSDDSKSTGNNEVTRCKFGNLRLHIGAVFKQITDNDYYCTRCVCEVPPIPTCQYVPRYKCN